MGSGREAPRNVRTRKFLSKFRNLWRASQGGGIRRRERNSSEKIEAAGSIISRRDSKRKKRNMPTKQQSYKLRFGNSITRRKPRQTF